MKVGGGRPPPRARGAKWVLEASPAAIAPLAAVVAAPPAAPATATATATAAATTEVAAAVAEAAPLVALGALEFLGADIDGRVHVADVLLALLEGPVLPHVEAHVAPYEGDVPVVHEDDFPGLHRVDLGLPERQQDRPGLIAHGRLRQLAGAAELRVDGPSFAYIDDLDQDVRLLGLGRQILDLSQGLFVCHVLFLSCPPCLGLKDVSCRGHRPRGSSEAFVRCLSGPEGPLYMNLWSPWNTRGSIQRPRQSEQDPRVRGRE